MPRLDLRSLVGAERVRHRVESSILASWQTGRYRVTRLHGAWSSTIGKCIPSHIIPAGSIDRFADQRIFRSPTRPCGRFRSNSPMVDPPISSEIGKPNHTIDRSTLVWHSGRSGAIRGPYRVAGQNLLRSGNRLHKASRSTGRISSNQIPAHSQ
jgi:hypothetical protein